MFGDDARNEGSRGPLETPSPHGYAVRSCGATTTRPVRSPYSARTNSAEIGHAIGAASASARSTPVTEPLNDCANRNQAITTGPENAMMISHTAHTRRAFAIASRALCHRLATIGWSP